MKPQRRPYLVFEDGETNILGLTGPYRDKPAALAAMSTLLAADKQAMHGWDLDSVPPEGQCIFAPWYMVRVWDLSVEEIQALGAATQAGETLAPQPKEGEDRD